MFDLEKIKNIDFNSKEIQESFDKIEAENKKIIESSKVKIIDNIVFI